MNELLYIALTLVLAAGTAYYAIPSILRIALLKNLCDKPNGRSATKSTIPTLGGIAIYLGFILSLVIGSNSHTFTALKYVIAAITIMFFIGLKDDILNISVKKKLIGQIASSLIIIILADVRFTTMHGFAGIYDMPYLVSVLFTLFVMIVTINAFNLIDGIDGLASGVAIVSSTTFGIIFYINGNFEYTIMAAALVGSLISFFRFNVYGKKNKIFMGDTGSLIIGTVMSVLLISFTEMAVSMKNSFVINNAPALAISILIVPFIDTLRVFTIRLMAGKSPFHADKRHLHHRLLDLGYSHIQATMILIIANICSICIGLLLNDISPARAILIIIPLAIIASLIPSYMSHKRNEKQSRTRTYPD